MRTGVIAQKVGMTRIFDEGGEHVPVTVMKLEDVQVVAHKTRDRDGYSALQLGYGSRRAHRVSKSLKGHFAKAKVPAKAKLVEFRVEENALVPIGAEIRANHFVPGQYVDVTGTSIGKGFAGGMKRHNFRGLEASHGVSISHRSHGSTGQCQDPGKVFKGKKMAGQLGAARSTAQNLEIVTIDEAENLILIKGAVPGPKNGFVRITDALKRALPAEAPFPYAEPKAAAKEEVAAGAEAAPAEETKQDDNA